MDKFIADRIIDLQSQVDLLKAHTKDHQDTLKAMVEHLLLEFIGEPAVSRAVTNKLRKDERRRIWDEINKHIKAGDLQGDGCNDLAQRNGLVMATNIIFQMGI